MTNEQQQPERASGCPPHEFGNRLAWHWTREMPRPLKGGFLTMLYALRAMASTSGQLRFNDGKPIRIQDIAKAAGCREKDARRYLEAAIVAGVVATIGERRRGRPTVYVTLTCPWPNWSGAADYLKSTARPRKTEDAETPDESSGHSGPNSDGAEVRAAVARTEEEAVRASAAPMGSGLCGPNGSGLCGPNTPRVTQERTQELADVVPQAEAGAGAREDDDSPNKTEDASPARQAQDVRRCPRCQKGTIVRPDREVCGRCVMDDAKAAKEARQKPVQGAFLLPLTGGQGAPRKPVEHVQWPQEDPTALLRVCGCGREYRLRNVDCCPDCLMAAEEQRRALEAVSNG
ncbi:hypothetical protein HUT18_11875 [Streptomyces sp. NA04227]|uniref:hypothetical protein n=1 Tax=Streptomyces sp. NA04227 TaxID=2742136 RepID=UPI001590D58E|nr:hypothetical protein [Streptomyces sp. NA04227]QKW06996.1 hypothetical protein HUT18_11875 [Streptomyces sp. NA04227]